MEKTPTWKALVHEIVSKQPREFRLADVLKHRDVLQRHFPSNRFVDAKIRQSLQVLRDQGVLRFVGSGLYLRLDVKPAFSPLIDLSVAAEYISAAQSARVAVETWASFNLYCLNCASDALFGAKIAGAAFAPTIDAIRSEKMPEHVLVEYDTRFKTVVFVDAIPGRLITEERVVPRKPLGPHARRAGWQGCTILVSDLPTVRIVAPAGVDRTETRKLWEAL